jgi:hypothetical protein
MNSSGRANRVDPHLIFGLSLLLALGVSWPSLSGAMHGTVDIVQAGVHLLGALAIAWAGCYGIGSLLYSYSQNDDGSGAQAAAAAVAGGPLRRATDAAATIPMPVTPEIEASEADAA